MPVLEEYVREVVEKNPMAQAPIHAARHGCVCEKLPAELWLKIANEVEDPRDLVSLATVCKGILPTAEDALYKHVEINTRHSLFNFALTALTRPHKAQRVRSLAIRWSKFLTLDSSMARELVVVLTPLTNLAALHYAPPARVTEGAAREFQDHLDWAFEREWFAAPASVRVLACSTAFLIALNRMATLPPTVESLRPRPPLVALSVHAHEEEMRAVCRLASGYGKTLRRLRIFRHRTMPTRWENTHPTRVCAELDAPQLEYLEILDTKAYYREVRHNTWVCNASAECENRGCTH